MRVLHHAVAGDFHGVALRVTLQDVALASSWSAPSRTPMEKRREGLTKVSTGASICGEPDTESERGRSGAGARPTRSGRARLE